MKLSIGTAQFGLKYGICNKDGVVKKNEVKKIIDYCKLKNIKSLDTAQGYGRSHKVLGSTNLKKIQITTKISIPKNIGNKNLEDFVILEINKILKELNVKKIHAVLIHNTDQLKNKFGNNFFNVLQKLKKRKKILKIGVSVYTKKELEFIVKNFNIDIVNLPLSIANREFYEKNYLLKLKKKKIEIHVRSIFLQGLLLSNQVNLPKKFKNNNFFLQWFKWLKMNKYNPLDVSLGFIKGVKYIDKIVIGVDNFSQLESIVRSYKKNPKLKYKKFIQSSLLKKPSTW